MSKKSTDEIMDDLIQRWEEKKTEVEKKLEEVLKNIDKNNKSDS